MDKEKVLQLAKEAEILRQLSMEVPFVVDRLERFAALIEREVRGNAASGDIHSCSYYCTRPECIKAQRDELRDRVESAPAVVAQLVEAAKRAMNYAENVVMAEGVYFDHDDDLPFIESALAAAKETGI